jgi:hypothetical protein
MKQSCLYSPAAFSDCNHSWDASCTPAESALRPSPRMSRRPEPTRSPKTLEPGVDYRAIFCTEAT